MKVKRSFIVTLFIIFFIFLIPQAVTLIKREYQANQIYDSCKRIQLGMAENEVISIMGEAGKTTFVEKNGQKRKYISYLGGGVAAVNPHCIIDPESGKVIKIVCDDND